MIKGQNVVVFGLEHVWRQSRGLDDFSVEVRVGGLQRVPASLVTLGPVLERLDYQTHIKQNGKSSIHLKPGL